MTAWACSTDWPIRMPVARPADTAIRLRASRSGSRWLGVSQEAMAASTGSTSRTLTSRRSSRSRRDGSAGRAALPCRDPRTGQSRFASRVEDCYGFTSKDSEGYFKLRRPQKWDVSWFACGWNRHTGSWASHSRRGALMGPTWSDSSLAFELLARLSHARARDGHRVPGLRLVADGSRASATTECRQRPSLRRR